MATTETARRRVVQLLGIGAATGAGIATAAADGAAQRGDEAAATTAGSGLRTVESDADFETTVSRVEPALEARDLDLVTTIDHAANAASIGQSLPPTTLFLFGNPAVGTQFMRRNRSVAIDLPQKLLVWADGGSVFLTYTDPEHLAVRHGVDAADERLTRVAAGLEELVSAIAEGEEPAAH